MTTYSKFNILEPVINSLKNLNVKYTVYHDVDDSDTLYGINNRKIKAYLLENNVNCIIRTERVGKFNNIMSALRDLFLQDDFVVVIDDDVILTEAYLKYCEFAANKFKDDESIGAVGCSNLYNFYDTTKYFYKTRHPHPSIGAGIWKDRFVKYGDKLNLLKHINLDSKLDIPQRVKENLSFFRDGKMLDINIDFVFSLIVEFFNFKIAMNCTNMIGHLDQIEMSRSRQAIDKYLAPIVSDIPDNYIEITDDEKIKEMDLKRIELSHIMNNEPRQSF